MSVDTPDQLDEAGHHEDPELVERRQRLGLWLFIGGDAILLGALLFTYLYLRGTNTDGNWRHLTGYDFRGFSPAQAQDLLNHVPPRRITEGVVSVGTNWAIVAVVVLSALAIWYGESLIRRPRVKASKFIPFAYLAALIALAAVVLEFLQMRNIPEFFQVQNDSQLFVHTAYGSAMLAFGVALVIHLGILAFAGVGLAVRATRGRVWNREWHQVRFVRIFWVWVAASTLLTALVTQFWH
jgi:heme/copper-type cytochrome/quinol oxidase subunit 3